MYMSIHKVYMAGYFLNIHICMCIHTHTHIYGERERRDEIFWTKEQVFRNRALKSPNNHPGLYQEQRRGGRALALFMFK